MVSMKKDKMEISVYLTIEDHKFFKNMVAKTHGSMVQLATLLVEAEIARVRKEQTEKTTEQPDKERATGTNGV